MRARFGKVARTHQHRNDGTHSRVILTNHVENLADLEPLRVGRIDLCLISFLQITDDRADPIAMSPVAISVASNISQPSF